MNFCHSLNASNYLLHEAINPRVLSPNHIRLMLYSKAINVQYKVKIYARDIGKHYIMSIQVTLKYIDAEKRTGAPKHYAMVKRGDITESMSYSV